MYPIRISALRRLLAIGLLTLVVPWAGAQEESQRCIGLRFLALESGYVTSSDVIAATEELPAYCRVRARALPEISVEVRLPMEEWNLKYYQTGCGGFCGILGRADKQNAFINAMGPGLKRGYATATSDSGHHGMSVIDAAWADHNPAAERDWGWRSIGETHRVARALIEAFYGRSPEHDYFQGCSTGGRMANMAALRYPDMFDGIISGAPAMDYTGLVALSMAWIVQANTDSDGAAILKPGKDALISAEVLRQCDSVDGASDGLIADPRECDVDLSTLQCENDTASETCLSAAELQVIAKWRQGPRNAAGEQLYPGGIPEGSEAFWWLWLTGKPEGGGKLVPLFASNFGAYMAFADDPGASYSPLDFDFEKDPARLATMGEVYNADAADIGAFRDAGGKLLVWHGWADAIVTPYKTAEWYGQLAENMGGEEAVGQFARLFMIPGMDHCGLLPGPGGVDQWSIDPLGALEKWVEAGEAPESIMR
jgi:feruloyl esterase